MKKSIAVLCGILMGSVALQANAASLYDIATACTWTFGTTAGAIYTTALKLSLTGRITGYTSANEFSWGVADGNLFFAHQDGRLSTRFTSAAIDASTGRIILKGNFLLGGVVTHALTCHQ